MDSVAILVLGLSLGVIALLAWFEISSRRNETKMASKSTFVHSGVEAFKNQGEAEVASDTERKKVT